MSERKPGWYWVLFVGRWNAAEWVAESEYWQVAGMESSVEESCFDEIGPRIPTPDEPWRPDNCRNELQEKGNPYPKSGCEVCGGGGLSGCPYERNAEKEDT